jgi:hypothetical protein
MERIADPQILGSTDTMNSPTRTPVSFDYWKTPEFRKLQLEWYAKIEAAGFIDIEDVSQNEYISSSQEFNKNNKGEQNGSGPDYYEYCHKILREFRFKREMHREIFEKHTEGMPTPEISEWLSAHELHKPMTFQGIAHLIDRIKQDYSRG